MVRFRPSLKLRLDLLSKAAQGLGWGAARPAGRAAEDGPVRRDPETRAGAHQSPMAMRSEHSEAKVSRTGTHLEGSYRYIPNGYSDLITYQVRICMHQFFLKSLFNAFSNQTPNQRKTSNTFVRRRDERLSTENVHLRTVNPRRIQG